ncbi:probable aquaporin TIP4-3, partial [Phalaenopsis equestris]|uniref:probable aquaporin TIP4-3 n=1 Tax=Phalaenopsis equestris TaxID=78828 RepID=UPI0009E3990F
MLTKLAQKLSDIDLYFLRSTAGELFLTFLFVFTTVGAAMASAKTSAGRDSVTGLMVAAAANTLAVAAIVSAGAKISGAHLNPVVTLAMALGGRISWLRFVFYFIVQLVGSSLACLVLRFISGGM